ncbi:MAG: Clp1/GlmU family protein [Amphritea sp.]
MNSSEKHAYNSYAPEKIIADYLTIDRRVLIFGESGIGKSTLASRLIQLLIASGRHASLLDADPGSPAFGIPGAVCMVDQCPTDQVFFDRELSEGIYSPWKVRDFEALCSLDAGRFRLPLADLVRRLLARSPQGNAETLIIDAPGVTRGVAAAELLSVLVAAADIDLVLILVRKDQPPPLFNELSACGAQLVFVVAHKQARKPEKESRRRERSCHWQAYMAHATEQDYNLDRLGVLGTPPPVSVPTAWAGRQVALIEKQRTLAMGQVVSLDNHRLRILTPNNSRARNSRQLLIRDAVQTPSNGLHTATPFRSSAQSASTATKVIALTAKDALFGRMPIDKQSPPVIMRIGPAEVILVNGVFGDPLLLMRLGYQKRCLLFDLGDHGQLSARIAHQVSDVFISHAHIDHISGFLWLLRCRIGYYPPCRLFGPPGLAQNIAGMISGILWDRIGDKAPTFDIFELHGERLRHWQITTGSAISDELPEQVVTDSVIWQEALFRVRAAVLDHSPLDHPSSGKAQRSHHTPVLAFAFEPSLQLKVRKDQLEALNLTAGPWLQQLKEHVLNGKLGAHIQLADRSASVADLAARILIKSSGQKLAYATDFADIPDNHARLTVLAKKAHTLFCEASFVNADVLQAARTGHLTTRACGQIGSSAAVEHLMPFHFSRRYQPHSERSYQEVKSACSNTVVPQPWRGKTHARTTGIEH